VRLALGPAPDMLGPFFRRPGQLSLHRTWVNHGI
jgi:hypothetical protein